MSDLRISTVAFEPDGLIITYIDPATDVRVKGRVVVSHQAMLSAAHPDYREDIEQLHHKVQRILRNALEDFAQSDPYVADEDDDLDPDRGMGE